MQTDLKEYIACKSVKNTEVQFFIISVDLHNLKCNVAFSELG
jgi:hypothetical protein